MSDKPNSVFEKLDLQGEQINDISDKLDGVSVNDLYALAKRTWEYKDYQTAQKYYNHISLLRPLDWEAPLYASLCNFHGYHDMWFWAAAPEQLGPIYISTIKYINNLDLDKKQKESEISRCTKIIKDDMTISIKHYYKYPEDFSNIDPDYVFHFEEMFINVLFAIKDIKLDSLKPFCSFLADSCLEIVKSTKSLSKEIDKEKFDYLNSISSKNWDIDYLSLIKKQKELDISKTLSGEKLTQEEKNNIMLRGKLYYEYSDKVLLKRLSRRNLIFGLIILIASIGEIIYSIFVSPYYAIAFALPVLTSAVLISKSFLDKNRINCKSIIAFRRKRHRLTSNNSVVRENAVGIFAIYVYMATIISCVAFIYLAIISFLEFNEVNIGYRLAFTLCGLINVIVQFINQTLLSSDGYTPGSYVYLYNGQYYKFK